MPALRKLFVTKSLYFITFRTEEGLPFVPIELINEIIWAALARAQYLYPVKVVTLNFAANHSHKLLIAENPEDLPLFVGYVKQETAHAINRLLGRRKRTVWVEGYDSPVVLDSEKAIEILLYILLNSVKDGLTNSIDEYPGVSSWKLFKEKTFKRKCLRIKRDSIRPLKDPNRPWVESKKVLKELKAQSPKTSTLTLSPYAWKECFEDTKDLSDAEVRDLMLRRLEEKEKEYLKERKSPARTDLTRQSILKPYVPTKFGKRMICHSSNISLRKRFISYFKYLCEKAREVYLKWKAGDWSIPFPTGLFPPCLPRAANLLPPLLEA